jgi:hypothetical protein
MFASIFMAIREALTGLFTQRIVDAIRGLFGGFTG